MRKLELYTDGSYNKVTGKCTGAFVVIEDNKVLKGAQVEVVDNDLKQSWNVSGELLTAVAALNVVAGILGGEEAEVIVHHDYIGISKYVATSDKWVAKKPVAVLYTKAFEAFKKDFPTVSVSFHKVKAHSGNYWNEVVDSLAKGHRVAACYGKMLPEIKI